MNGDRERESEGEREGEREKGGTNTKKECEYDQ